MNRAKDLFFALLPSSVHLVRRAAAEGLSMLATLGVTEDAHTLQSSILHSLDELMKGNLPDGTVRKFQLNNDALSSVKAGSLLTLACIQRTAQKMDSDERDRVRARSLSAGNVQPTAGESVADTAPQTMIMLTRVLPYSLESDFFNVRTHALHALELLISYSVPEKDGKITAESLHILQKAVETIESNFLSTWTAITADFDGGREVSVVAIGILISVFLFTIIELSNGRACICLLALTLYYFCAGREVCSRTCIHGRIVAFHDIPPSPPPPSPDVRLLRCKPLFQHGLFDIGKFCHASYSSV